MFLVFVKRRRIYWQNDLKSRAFTLRAGHVDATPVMAHDVLSHPEPKPRSLYPRREERLEYSRQVLFAYAAPPCRLSPPKSKAATKGRSAKF